MLRSLVAIPFAGLLVLIIGALAPEMVGDLFGATGSWRQAFEVRSDPPQCWSLGLTYCRYDWTRQTPQGPENGSLRYLTVSPLPSRMLILRSELLPIHTTAAAARERLVERAAVWGGLVLLLCLTIWREIAAAGRNLRQGPPTAERMAAAGWHIDEPTAPAAPAQPQRRPAQSSFGRRR